MDKSGSVHVHLGIWSMIKDDSSSTKLLCSQWPIYLRCISHPHVKLMSKSSVPYCKVFLGLSSIIMQFAWLI